MKGFLGGIFMAAPITALLVMIFLDQRTEIAVKQERQNAEIRLDAARFDRDFDRMTAEIDGSLPTAEKQQIGAEKRDERQARKKLISGLNKRVSDFDAEIDRSLSLSRSDSKAARDALAEAPPPALPELPDLN